MNTIGESKTDGQHYCRNDYLGGRGADFGHLFGTAPEEKAVAVKPDSFFFRAAGAK
jgi:hypothetical protein